MTAGGRSRAFSGRFECAYRTLVNGGHGTPAASTLSDFHLDKAVVYYHYLIRKYLGGVRRCDKKGVRVGFTPSNKARAIDALLQRVR